MLRAICCVIVVFLHAFIGAEIHPGLDRSYELGGLIGYQLLLWATPLFAVLSGFVLFHRNREVASPVEFWQRRGGAVLVPFLFWTAVYWLVQPAYGHPLRIATGLVLGQSGQRHLYFVAMILQFYALFPVLCRWSRTGGMRRLLLPAFGISAVYSALFAYFPAPAGGELLWEFSDSLLPGWLFYLVLGAVLSEEQERLRAFLAGGWGRAAGLAAAAIGLLLAEYLLFPVVPRDYGSRRPVIILYTVALLPLLWLGAQALGNSAWYPRLKWLAARSFAVYLIHPLALHGFRYAVPAPDDLVSRVVLYATSCGALTALGVWLVRRLPHGDRVLGIAGPRVAEARETCAGARVSGHPEPA